MKKQLSTLLIIIGFLLNSCNDTFMHESSSNLATQQQQEISSSKLSIIGIDFDEFVMTITGTDLVINKFTPSMIKISGRISAINYIERR